MTCTTSLKEEKRPLNSTNKIEQASNRGKQYDIKKRSASETERATCDHASLEGNAHEKQIQETPKDKPTMIVCLQVPRKTVANIRDDCSDGVQRKSPAQKELNSNQRKKQIAEYNSLKLKEERQQRYRIRYGDDAPYCYGKCSPSNVSTNKYDVTLPARRKKRVSFEF